MSRRRSSLVPYKLSAKSYLLSDISRSNCPLPLPCLVEDGYYGASAWDTVSAGEVIFLNTLEKRPRALATDGQKHYSIPLDYPLKFSVISKGNDYSIPSSKTIEEIVNHYKLPVTLKVDQRNTTLHLATNLRSILHLGNVDVTRTYDEKYFTGHAVIHNELQNETIMLPTFLKVRVRIIEGINGFSTAQWVDVLEAWKAIVKQAPSHAIKPPIDIVMFSSIPIEAQSSRTATTIERKLKEDIYETLEPTTYVKLNYNLAQRRSNVYTTLSTTTAPQQQPATTSTGDTETKRQSTVASMVAAAESSVKKSNPVFHTELQQTLSSRSPSESPRPTPPRVPAKLTKSISEDPSRRRNPPTPSADTTADKPSSSKQPLPSNAGQTPLLPPTTQNQPVVSESRPNQSGSCPPDPDVEIDPDYQISPRTHSGIHSLKDVPASVEKLNIEEVADCLRLLKMAKYIDSFLANQVDGTLLLECNEDILTNDLQMTSLHAKKLVMFAQKGWRPQQGSADDIRL